jgi:predicted ATPase/DNA-binding CsgD family transcriptional regulator/DNA-binding XRE family transcriptional regulator
VATDQPRAFGEALRRYRRAAGLTQEELAQRARLSVRGIADLERGARRAPYRETVRRLADALGVAEAERAALLAASRPARQASPRLPDPRPTTTRRPPVPLSSFIGRVRELAELTPLLDTTRLLTLTGSGGVGKTRLALELAAAFSGPRMGAVIVAELASLADAEQLPQTVAAALGIREQPGRPLLAVLADAIQGPGLLLVLDNCEHLVEGCAQLADYLLRCCPELRILATSREPLDIEGEIAWRVPSLSLPGSAPATAPELLQCSEAVQLFVHRAAAVLPSFELNEANAPAVGRLCERLDGIPLALELAAARVAVLSVQQIFDRLDDALRLLASGHRLVPARQQTLRATLDWSYRLLTAPEQRLLDRLAVFAGGWTLEAAEAIVAMDGLDAFEVLDLLSLLVDKSLVVVEREPAGLVRYRLLETVRQYAHEQLSIGNDAERVRARHAAYFVDLVEWVEPELFGHGHLAAQARLEREHDNCRAALRWLVDQSDTEVAQRLAGALGRFWFYRGYLSESAAWTERALALPDGDRPTSGRAKCLWGCAVVSLSRADYGMVERLGQEARALWHGVGNTGEEGFALFLLGHVARLRGDFSTAHGLLEEGLQLCRAGGHAAGEANCLWSLAELAADQGAEGEARLWAEAAVARATEAGWTIGLAVARRVLGALHARRGEYGAAAALLEASLAEARALGARWWIAETLAQLGHLALKQGDPDLAGPRFGESLGLARALGDQAGIARALEGIAQLAILRRAAREGVQLAAAAAALRERIRAPLSPTDRSQVELALASARQSLDEPAASAAWAEGRSLEPSRAIDLALVQAQPETPARSARSGQGTLTERELEVARLVADGLTNRQIAEQLVIAEGTAERHVGNILAKLDMTTRAQVAAWVVGSGLLRQASTS